MKKSYLAAFVVAILSAFFLLFVQDATSPIYLSPGKSGGITQLLLGDTSAFVVGVLVVLAMAFFILLNFEKKEKY